MVSFSLILLASCIPLWQLIVLFDFSAVNNVNINYLSKLFFNSVLIVSAASVIAMTIGTGFAYILASVHLRYSIVLVILLTLNFFIPSYIHALTWSRLFSNDSFLILLFSFLGGDTTNTIQINPWFATVWVLALSYFPIIFIVVYLSCFSWTKNMQDAALLHGTPWKAFAIKIKFLGKPIIMSTLLVFLLIFSDFGVPDLFQISMYSTEIFIELSSFYNNSKSLFISLPYIALSLLVLWIFIKLSNKLPLSLPSAIIRPAKIYLNRRWSFATHVLLYVSVLVLIILPLLNLVYLTTSVDVVLQAFILVKGDLANSIVFAATVSALIIVITLYAAYGYVRMRSTYKDVARIILLLILMLPASLIALSLISFWNQDGILGWFYQSEGIVILGVMTRWLPIAFELLLLAWLFVNDKQENAALLFGKNWWSVVTKIHYPMMKPFVLAIFLLCFILAFNELTMMVLLSPPGMTLLPSRIFSVIHYGPDNLVAAICLIQILTILIILLVLAWFNRQTVFSRGV